MPGLSANSHVQTQVVLSTYLTQSSAHMLKLPSLCFLPGAHLLLLDCLASSSNGSVAMT